jgi:thioredoxin-related protein
MKKFILGLILISYLGVNAQEQKEEVQWLTDYNQALKIAKEENKPMLILFTGSDWCPPCKAMHKDLFHNKEFIDLSKRFVLLFIDFPKRKALPEKQREHNYQIASKYHRGGVPTMVFVTPDEKVITKLSGYRYGQPERNLGVMKKILESYK